MMAKTKCDQMEVEVMKNGKRYPLGGCTGLVVIGVGDKRYFLRAFANCLVVSSMCGFTSEVLEVSLKSLDVGENLFVRYD